MFGKLLHHKVKIHEDLQKDPRKFEQKSAVKIKVPFNGVRYAAFVGKPVSKPYINPKKKLFFKNLRTIFKYKYYFEKAQKESFVFIAIIDYERTL